VESCCRLLGLDPLHLANEGRFVLALPADQAAAAAAILAPGGGRWIGEVRAATGAAVQVRLRTCLGSQRLLAPFSGELLPRIC
jgi:hydrogenase expression/formation protein HypE